MFRKEDNDIEARSKNRRPATLVTSRKSIVKNGNSSGGSRGIARSVVDEEKVSNVELISSLLSIYISMVNNAF